MELSRVGWGGWRVRLFCGYRLVGFIRPGPQVGAMHQQAGAGVPAEDGVVVGGGLQSDGPLIAFHGMPESVVGRENRVGRSFAKLRVRRALPDDAGVVVPLEIVREARQNFACFGRTGAMAELIRERQQQHHQRPLVVRIDAQHVQTNAFGERWFVQEPVALRFLERLGDAGRGEMFQGELPEEFFHRLKPVLPIIAQCYTGETTAGKIFPCGELFSCWQVYSCLGSRARTPWGAFGSLTQPKRISFLAICRLTSALPLT